jgi:hypothetical protein
MHIVGAAGENCAKQKLEHNRILAIVFVVSLAFLCAASVLHSINS